MKENYQDILALLPYGPSFCFVDELLELNEEGVIGQYRFAEDAPFYADHFPEDPITPGVLLLECMAQIGLVCLGIYLLKEELQEVPKIAFSSSKVNFYQLHRPGELLRVEAKKKLFRLQQLRVTASAYNEAGDLVAKAELAGMWTKKNSHDAGK
ncbi:3-hydroxyacyl-ACP dehydratase FabZ family protein [Saprospira grandis]|uniref:3-hydroxyacyl-ACP dehydratase FabZ family protein n=1 Tax=Saprospira grandis TaxID=1008 RepID=UPI0022DE43FE|nr:hydroxymyristoyl-ACP dehydratase [Saprospira grandis]WBM75668.1 hydroxymyristoyl-ACP dehydratase [Saprospira grandis]